MMTWPIKKIPSRSNILLSVINDYEIQLQTIVLHAFILYKNARDPKLIVFVGTTSQYGKTEVNHKSN